MRARILALALGIALPARPTWAQDEPPPDDAPVEEAPEAVRLSDDQAAREGEYGGVKPGVLPRNASGRPVKGARPGTLTWVGFQDEGGVAKIFLQAAGEFSYSQRVEGSTIVIHLEGIKRLALNVRRPVDTRFFDTPVSRITVKKVGRRKASKGRPARKAGYEVRIALKRGEAAREVPARTATEADGMFYLYLDVGPSGAAAPAEEPAPAATP